MKLHSPFSNLFLVLIYLSSCTANSDTPNEESANKLSLVLKTESRINGASLVASMHPIDSSEFRRLDSMHVNFICLLPFAFVKEGEPVVHYNAPFQWWGERPEGIAACIQMAHEHGMHVMVKPQLWVSHGKFTGELQFDNENEWSEFEKSYSAYLFQLLDIADSLHAEYFCLGTELGQFVKARKTYWSALIDSARMHYHGKLTYAENWDCYDAFPYWNKLDAMGVNAYFPLSDASTPPVDELLAKWEPYFTKMKTLSAETGKHVLFTEYGYRSIDYATRRPWESYTDGKMNLQAQQNGYEALFQKFWKEPWVEGGFFWKWFDAQTQPDIASNLDFTPQQKPAAAVIRHWYGQ